MTQLRTCLSTLLVLCWSFLTFAQTNPCDTIEVVAEAGAQNLTCSSPIGSVAAVLHPNTFAYAWAGPNGFSSTTPSNAVTVAGVYTLTVTGPLGCTATTAVTVADDCDSLSFGLEPPVCPNGTVSPAETCEQACVSACLFPYWGTTAPFTGDPEPPGGFCSQIQNDQWIAFLPPVPNATLRLTPSNCAVGNGLQMALYSGCDGDLLVCNSGCQGCGSTPIQMQLSNLTPGKVYYLMIDGYSGDQCDFLLEEISGAICDTVPPEPCEAPSITGPAQVCPGGTYTYTITPAPGCIPNGYYITGDNGIWVNGQPLPTTVYAQGITQIEVSFFSGFTGNTALGVRALKYFTTPSAPAVKNISVQALPPTILPTAIVCAEDVPYQLPSCDILCFASGNYCCTLTSSTGCDSVVCQQVIIKPNIIRQIARVICQGDSVQICGSTFSQSGQYMEVCESYQGCDSTVFLSLNVLSPVATITGGGVLSCTNPSLTLGSANSPNNSIKRWYLLGQQGVLVGQGNSLTVTQPGTYVLETTQSAGGIQCVATDTIVIGSSGVLINAQIAGGELRCDQPQTTLTASTNATSAAFSWTGPGGVSLPNEASVVVSAPGVYTVTVTDTNACTATATFVVTGNTAPPLVSVAANGAINCLSSELTLVATANLPNLSFQWAGPGIVNSSGATQVVSLSGDYTVVASDNFGCSASATISVAADTIPPAVNASASNELTCATPSAQLVGTPAGGNLAVCWIFPNGTVVTMPVIEVNTPGAYIFKVTGANGCTASDTLTLNADPDVPDVQAFQAPLLCGVAEMTLQAISSVADATFVWTTPDGLLLTGASQTVTLSGTYTVVVTAPNGCSNSQALQVNGPALFPQVALSSGELNCFTPQINLVATVNSNVSNFVWEGPPGFSGTNNAVQTITLPGVYTVTVTNAFNCSATATTTITQNVTAPTATITGAGVLTCNNPNITLIGASNTAGVTFSWIGQGVILQGQTVTVNLPGTYTLVVTAPNGCTGTAAVTIVVDAIPPFIQAGILPIACGDTTVTLISSAPSDAEVVWTGPNGFFSEEDNPEVNVPGVYTAIATGANGCTSSQLVVAPQLESPLTLIVSADSITCDQPIAQLSVTTNVPNALYQWSGPNNFNSNLANPVTDMAGIYTVVAVNPENGCTAVATVEVTDDCVSGVLNPGDAAADIKVYPVPAVSWLQVELPEVWGLQDTRLFLHAADGRLVRSWVIGAGALQHTLPVEGIAAGHYQLSALQLSRQSVVRVIITR